jgi:AraC-like DNA-binding protein
MDPLSEMRAIVGRFAKSGAVSDSLPRLRCLVRTKVTEPTSATEEALLALVLQGSKRTVLGSRTFDFGAGEFCVTSVRAPVTIQTTRASTREPFLAVGLLLDPSIVASLLLKEREPRSTETPLAIATSQASDAMLDAFRRYLRLLAAPRDVPVLAEPIEREILWRVMQSPQGATLRAIGRADSHLALIGRAVEVLQHRFAEPLAIGELARVANMSGATFHRHFRKVTAMSPLQFQKQLRLQAARARLLSHAGDVTSVSRLVGYQSPSQFSREYRRQFGVAPGGEVARAR